jgi:hypothetical protein
MEVIITRSRFPDGIPILLIVIGIRSRNVFSKPETGNWFLAIILWEAQS